MKVFLCHASDDKAQIRALYKQLAAAGVTPWLDEEDLLPGQDWESEIRKAVKSSDMVLVCLSQTSISKTGFVQKEIRFALDVADEQLLPISNTRCRRLFCKITGSRAAGRCKPGKTLAQYQSVTIFNRGARHGAIGIVVHRTMGGPAG